jgi:hypothetical protein
MPDKDRETRYQTVDKRDEWRCRYCPQRYLVDGGTTIITAHLTTKHGLEAESLRDQQVKNQQITINEALREAENHPQKKRKLYYRANGDKINGTVLEILWVNVLVACFSYSTALPSSISSFSTIPKCRRSCLPSYLC